MDMFKNTDNIWSGPDEQYVRILVSSVVSVNHVVSGSKVCLPEGCSDLCRKEEDTVRWVDEIYKGVLFHICE